MSTYNKGPENSVYINDTVPEFGLIVWAAGGATLSTGVANGDKFLLGVALDSGVAGDTISYLARNCASFKAIADGAIAAGSLVYTGADGEITETTTSLTVAGVTKDASTADGDIIEVYRVAAINEDV